MILQRFWYSFFALCISFGALFSYVFAQTQVDEQDLEKYYGQSIEVRLYEPPAQSMKGELRFNTLPFSVGEVQFFLVGEDEEVLVWKETQKSVEVKSIDGGRSGIDFDIDVSDIGLSGGYYLYVGLFDSFHKRIGVGKKILLFEKTSKIDLLSDVLISQSSDEKGSVELSFVAQNVSKSVRPVVEIYENSLEGSRYGEFQGDIQKVEVGEKVEFNLDFLWPTVPESYVVVVRVEGVDGTVYGGEIVKRIVVEGEFAEILGVRPEKGADLGDAEHLALEMKGYIPYGRFYDLQLALEQKNDQGVVQTKEKIVSINSEKEALFSVVETFDIDTEADTLDLRAQIVNPKTKEIIEQKDFSWSALASVRTVHAQGGVEKEPSERHMDTMRLYVLGSILVILALLMYLFFSNRKHLKALIVLPFLWGAGVQAADISGGYVPVVVNPSQINSYTTIDKEDGFNEVEIVGSLQSGGGTSAFEDQVLDDVVVSLKRMSDSSVIANVFTLDTKDVGLHKPLPTDPWSGYRLYLDLVGQSLVDDLYGVQLQFNFVGGDFILAERDNFFRVDTTNPTLSITTSDTASKDAKDITLTCTDDSSHCIDGDKAFVAKVKGNFCDGSSGDNNRLCKKNDSGEFYNTFEVCDGAGNCTNNVVPTEDLFYYDPYPPQMSKIELIRVEYDEGVTVPALQVTRQGGSNTAPVTSLGAGNDIEGRWARTNSDLDGTGAGTPTLAAHGRFAFDLVDDRDDDIDVGTSVDVGGQTFTVSDDDYAGPAADPNACGEREYDATTGTPAVPAYTDRDYGSGKKGDFYYGRSFASTDNKCRQRMVTCTNAPGQRGIWDRSVDPTNNDPETCTVDGQKDPTGGPCTYGQLVDVNSTLGDTTDDICIDCGDGYVYNVATSSCDPVHQCNPIEAEQIQSDSHAWYNAGTATDRNQVITFIVGNYDGTGAGACEWGCSAGWIKDPNTNACVPDCKDGLFPWCLDTECFGGGSCTVVNGSCGTADGQALASAPSTSAELCTTGTATNVVGAGPWVWSCMGGQGGTDDPCSATKTP